MRNPLIDIATDCCAAATYDDSVFRLTRSFDEADRGLPKAQNATVSYGSSPSVDAAPR